MPKLSVELRTTSADIDRLLDLHRNTSYVDPRYRKLIAEISLLRLFYVLENAFRVICCKALCGASYLDGTNPSTLTSCRSLDGAVSAMRTLGRARPHELKWSKVSEIKDNLRFVMAPTDSLVRTFDNHGTFIDEVRRVRNRIAHNNAGARANFRVIVKRHYGAELNWITPGTLLLSPRFSPTLMEQYLARSRVLLKTLVRG